MIVVVFDDTNFIDCRRKMAAKLAETEESLQAALTKAASAEKAKNRLNSELEDAIIDLEKVNETSAFSTACLIF